MLPPFRLPDYYGSVTLTLGPFLPNMARSITPAGGYFCRIWSVCCLPFWT